MTRRTKRELAAVLAAAGAAPREQDERELAAVLAVFTTAGSGVADGAARGTRAGASRPKRITNRLAVKCAMAFTLAAGCGVAVAGAGILPSPVQQFAHDVLGGVGVPAPGGSGTVSTGRATSSATATASVSSGSASTSPDPTVTALEVLCGAVAHDGNSWRTELSEDDQAALIAAAGGEQKVVSYCARLLAGSSSVSATPSGGATSAAASPDATAAHGNSHATHTSSPNPHSTAH